MKVIDCFIFYNEVEMLQYRLDILNDHVDYFILVESKYTFAGNEKTYFYNDNKELFEKFNSKIIHIMLDDCPFKQPTIDFTKRQQWENEYYQRNAIKLGIDQLVLEDEDIILLSDVDEIPDVSVFNDIKNNDFILNHVYCLEQDFYYYNLNSQMKKKWYYSKIITYKIYLELNMSFEEIRDLGLKCKIRKRGGWHLSYFGDKYFIINKMREFSHQEYNNSNYVSLDIIDSRIIYQTSLYETNKEESTEIIKLAIKDNEYLPPLYKEYLSKYIMY